MVVLTIAIGMAAAMFGHGPAGLLVQVVLAGFVGVQRIWFLRVWRKSPLELHEIAVFVGVSGRCWLALRMAVVFAKQELSLDRKRLRPSRRSAGDGFPISSTRGRRTGLGKVPWSGRQS